MDIRTKVTAVLTAGILAVAPIVAFALPNYTLNGNYDITGTLQVNTLAPGGCVTASSVGKLSTTGAACGGGGGGAVTSVTGSDTNGNLTVSPTTGAVVVSYANEPSYKFGMIVGFPGVYTQPNATIGIGTAYPGGNGQSELFTSGSTSNAGVTGSCLDIEQGGVGAVFDLDCTGNVGIAGSFASHALAGDVGDCLEAGTNGIIESAGAACGGGGVTSVTAGPSGNQTFAPTTGAVVGDIVEDPTFTGAVTDTNSAFGYYMDGSGTNPRTLVANQPVSGMTSNLGPDGSDSIAGVLGTLWAFSNYNGNNPTPLVTMDTSGDIGATSFSATNLTPGNCLQATTNGEIIDTGSACSAGGSGVTSITAGPTNNLTFTPGTGAVVGDIVTNPNFGFVTATGFGASNLTGGQCLQANGGQDIVSAGGACNTTQTLHGNQSITAAAAACTAGTPVVFSTPFTAVPDIVGSTSPVVGDSFSPSSITTTGFTPTLCSVASTAPATVYWSAQN